MAENRVIGRRAIWAKSRPSKVTDSDSRRSRLPSQSGQGLATM